MDIEGIFQSVQKQMEAELEAVRNALKHPGLKGYVNEETVRKFLRKHTPDNLSVGSGIIIDSNGSSSRQIDIIIYDRAKTPLLFVAGDVNVVPIECVYAVIEVKTQLKEKELSDCKINMESVKSLERVAYYPAGAIVHPKTMFGQEFDDWQTMYFVFCYESMSSEKIIQQLDSWDVDSPIEKRIDSIFSLSQGLITNVKDGKFDGLPSEGSKRICGKKNPLLLFYTLLVHYLSQAHIRNFKFVEYVKRMNF